MTATKNIFWFLFSWLAGLATLNSQIANYVANGSLEKYYTCDPSNFTVTYVINAKNWLKVGTYEADRYSHYCSSLIPFNGFFYNFPRTDSAYVSFDVLCKICPSSSNRTYVRNRLKSNLVSGKTYCVKFYVNLSEYSAYSINKIGAYFGDASLDTILDGDVPLTYLNPQVEANFFPLDTIGYSLITGTFTANGTEKYMVIGNFRSEASTDTVPNNLSPTSKQFSACTIALDDVSCIPIDLPAFAGSDTTCIPGTSVYIGRQRDVGIDEDCMWYKLPTTITPTTPAIDTAAGIWVSPVQTSTYVVRQEICGIIKWDTVIVYKNGVGLNEELKILNEELRIFPQPANNELVLKLDSDNGKVLLSNYDRIKIYNNIGMLIREEEMIFKEQNAIINTSALPDGIYVLQLRSDDKPTVNKRFIIAR